MLKLEFYGFFNSSFRFKNKTIFNTGFINFFMFICFLKKLIGYDKLKFSFLKKKTSHISFIKSNFKYKVSKHFVSKHANRFKITISINNLFFDIFFNKILKSFNMLTTTYINVNYFKVTNCFKNKIFFLI